MLETEPDLLVQVCFCCDRPTGPWLMLGSSVKLATTFFKVLARLVLSVHPLERTASAEQYWVDSCIQCHRKSNIIAYLSHIIVSWLFKASFFLQVLQFFIYKKHVHTLYFVWTYLYSLAWLTYSVFVILSSHLVPVHSGEQLFHL